MATAIGDIIAIVKADTTNFKSGMKDVTKQTKQVTSGFSNIGKTIKDVGLAFGVVFGAGQIVKGFKSVIKSSSDFQKAMIGLSTVADAFQISSDDAKEAAMALAEDGLMSVSEAADGLKNLLATGFSLPQAIDLMNGFKDSAAFNRQGMLGFGEAIVGATQGLKNQNSIMVDNAGVTKNLSNILKEAGLSAGDLGLVTSDATVRTALYNGILKETAIFSGDAEKASETYQGKVSALDTAMFNLKVTIGDKLLPAVTKFIDKLTEWVNYIKDNVIPAVENAGKKMEGLKEWFDKNWVAADYLAIMLGTTLLFAVSKLVIGLGTALVGAITSVISSFAALGLLLLPWFAVGGLIALLYTFFDFISRKTTGFTLLEQLLAMFELIKIKLKEVVEWFDKTIDKINIFKKKSSEAGGGGGGGSWGGKASGGLVEAGRSYIVGEFGRELFVPSQSGRIIPNNSLPDNINNKSVVQNINVYPSDGLDIDTIVERLAYKYRTSL